MQVQIYMVTVLRKPYSHKILDINICISSLNLHGIQNVNIAKKNIRKIYFLEKTNIFFFCENGLLRTVFLCFLVLSVLFISTFYCPHKAWFCVYICTSWCIYFVICSKMLKISKCCCESSSNLHMSNTWVPRPRLYASRSGHLIYTMARINWKWEVSIHPSPLNFSTLTQMR